MDLLRQSLDELPQPLQPVQMIGTRPHPPPAVAPRAEPVPRPARHLLAVGRLEVVVVDHAPAPVASAVKPGHESPGRGWFRRLSASRIPCAPRPPSPATSATKKPPAP
jgi:hypothetical protein